jgi:hypothetical protein
MVEHFLRGGKVNTAGGQLTRSVQRRTQRSTKGLEKQRYLKHTKSTQNKVERDFNTLDNKNIMDQHSFITTGGVSQNRSLLERGLWRAYSIRLSEMDKDCDRDLRSETFIIQRTKVLPPYLRKGKNSSGKPLATVATLFSAGFNKHYSVYMDLLTELVCSNHMNESIYHTLANLTPTVHQRYTEGAITSDDYSLYFDCAFNGHCPDEYYANVNQHDPLHLESNKIIQSATTDGSIDFLNHSLQLHSLTELYLAEKKMQPRLSQYRCQSITNVLAVSLRAPVVFYGIPDVISQILGVEVELYADQRKPGIYVVTEPQALRNVPTLTCQLSRAVLIKYARDAGLNGAQSAKFAGMLLLNKNIVDCDVGLTVGYQGKTNMFARGKAAFKTQYTDANTKRYEQAIAARNAQHTDDELTIQTNQSFDNQATILTMLDEVEHSVINDVDRDICVAHLKVLYPAVNAGLLSRTRVQWDQCYDILRVFVRKYPDAPLHMWLVKTGGMGLQGFASIMLIATLHYNVAALLHALLQKGVGARGYKHYVDITKEIHAVARRTGVLPQPVADLISSAAGELDCYKFGEDSFDFTELNGFDDPIVTFKTQRSPVGPGVGEGGMSCGSVVESVVPAGYAGEIYTQTRSPPSGVSRDTSALSRTEQWAQSLISSAPQEVELVEQPMMDVRQPAALPIADDCMYLNTLAGRTSDIILAGEEYVKTRTAVTTEHKLPNNTVNELEAQDKWARSVNVTMDQVGLKISEALAGVAQFTPGDFMAHFVQIAPAGSVGADKSRLAWMEDKHNATKRTWINSLSTKQLVELVEAEPMIQTNTLTKNENGKERILVPGSITHWAIESICIAFAEKAIYRSAPEFSLETDNWAKFVKNEKRRRRTARGGITVASDYKDFNYLHTVGDMKKFWRMVSKAASTLASEGEWSGVNYAGHIVRCCAWLEESLDRMYVREPHLTGHYTRVTRGLWSGWRTTSAINNLMNYVYMIALKTDIEQAGLPNVFISYELNGDDGDAETVDVVAGLLYLRTMTMAELDVQPAKQLLSTEQAEFLRIMFRKGFVKGSLARSVSSFVSSDMQSPAVDVGLDYTKGTSSALSQLTRRGAHWATVETLRNPMLLQYARMKWTELSEHKEVKLTKAEWLYVPEREGGFGCNRYGTPSLWSGLRAGKWPEAKIQWTLPGSPNTAISEMQTFVSKQLTLAKISPTIATLIARDAQQITDAGVDLVLNSRRLENSRKQQAQHILALNDLKPIITTPLTVDSNILEMVDMAMQRAFDSDDITLDSMQVIDIEERVSGYIGKNLGVMGISRQVLSMFRDAETDTRLTATAALMRLAGDNSWYAGLLLDYPTQLIDRMLNGTTNLPRGTCDTLSATIQPTLVFVQNTVLNQALKQLPPADDIVEQVDSLLKMVNKAYMIIYAQRYQYLWRE